MGRGLEKQEQGTCACSPHHPTIAARWEHRQDAHVPPAEQIHDIIAVL